jgi:energy-coupling factor transporter ATP-binding protein EcfA2
MSNTIRKDEPILETLVRVVVIDLGGSLIKLVLKVLLGILGLPFGKKKPGRVENTVTREDSKYLKDVVYEDMFGYSGNRRKAIFFKELDFKEHTFIVGTTGSGKTNLMKMLWENDIKRGNALIVIDPKSETGTIEYFKALNELHGRKYYIIDPSNPFNAYKYNPIGSGDAEIITQRIMDSFFWENHFYKNESKRVLQDTLSKIIKSGGRPTFARLYAELEKVDKDTRKNISGLLSQVHAFGSKETRFGNLFNTSITNEILTLERIREEGASVYFGASAMVEPEKTRTFGKLISMELAQHCGQVLIDKKVDVKSLARMSVYVDEAHDMLTLNTEPLLTQGRAAGLNLTVATQTLTILDRVGKEFLNTIWECSNNKIIFRQTSQKNLSQIIDSLGTFNDVKVTSQTIEGEVGERGSLREVNKYRVEPDVIRNLKVGECILSRQSGTIDLVKVKNAEWTKTYRLIQKGEVRGIGNEVNSIERLRKTPVKPGTQLDIEDNFTL